MTGNVVPLSSGTKASKARRRREPKFSLRELVRIADDVPQAMVPQTIADKLDILLSDGPPAVPIPAVQLREWVILGGLINRLLFELCALPHDPHFRI